MSEPRNDLERWASLVDRMAADETLTDEERAFCQTFERTHPLCAAELEAYAQLDQLDNIPDDASRALVDRTLAQLDRDDAERAAAEVRSLRRPRSAPLWAVAAVVIAGVSGVYGLRSQRVGRAEAPNPAHQPLARAELVYSSGNVNVSGHSAGAGHTLLKEGSVVETAAGNACVLIDSDINICLDAHSRIRLRTIDAPGRQVVLEAGKLATRLATQPEGMSLSILAADVASVAVGTAYSVELGSDGTVVTTVLNGKVRVGRGQQTALVSAHERAVTAHDAPHDTPMVTSVSRSEEATSWALLGPTVLWHDPVAATLDVRGDPAGAEIVLDEQPIGVAPLWSLVPVGEHHLVVRRAGVELTSRKLHLHAGELLEVGYHEPEPSHQAVTAPLLAASETTVVKSPHVKASKRTAPAQNAKRPAAEAAATSRPAPEAAATSNVTSNGELLRRARQAVRDGRFGDASRAYETLIGNDAESSEAQTALVLLGQLRLRQLHDPRGAIKVLEAYLRNGGSLEVEARVARIEALRQLQHGDDEAAAIEDFLQRHARSFEAKALRARLETLRDSPPR